MTTLKEFKENRINSSYFAGRFEPESVYEEDLLKISLLLEILKELQFMNDRRIK